MTILIGIIVGLVVIGGAAMLIVAGLRASRSKEEERSVDGATRGGHSARGCYFLSRTN